MLGWAGSFLHSWLRSLSENRLVGEVTQHWLCKAPYSCAQEQQSWGQRLPGPAHLHLGGKWL